MQPSLVLTAPADADEVPDHWYLQAAVAGVLARLDALEHPPTVLAGLGVAHRSVHTELEWASRVEPGAEVRVVVATAHVGHTSLTLDARLEAGSPQDPVVVCHVRAVHVLVVAADPGTRAEIPESLRLALGPARPLKPQGRPARR